MECFPTGVSNSFDWNSISWKIGWKWKVGMNQSAILVFIRLKEGVNIRHTNSWFEQSEELTIGI